MTGRIPKDSRKLREALEILNLRELSAKRSVYTLPEDCHCRHLVQPKGQHGVAHPLVGVPLPILLQVLDRQVFPH